MAEVFISYSRSDLEYVNRLDDFLREAGLSVWLDRSGIQTGDKWKNEIVKAIEECSAFVVVMSPTSLNSDWVNKELTYAEDLKKPIFPLLLEGKRFPLLADIQYEDVRDKKMPSGSLLVALSSARKVDNRTREYSVEKNAADLHLLAEFWQMIGSEVLQAIRWNFVAGSLTVAHYDTTLIRYRDIRTRAEKHFHSRVIEQEFCELDTAIEDFIKQVSASSKPVRYRNEVVMMPLFMFGGRVIPNRMTADEKSADRHLFLQAQTAIDSVLARQQQLVRLIKQEFPEFRFEAS